MSRIITMLIGALLSVAGFSALTGTPADSHPQAELDWGSFSESDPLMAHPVAFTWVYSNAGVRTEVWALYKMNQTGGWQEPGANHTSMTIDIDYLGNPAHTDIDDFKDWVEDQYDTHHPALEVSQSDLEIHVHTVTVQ